MDTPCDNAQMILTNQGNSLWLGNIESPQDKLFLDKNNIKTIFNVTRIKYINFPGITYYQIPLSDADTPKEMKHFLEVADRTADTIHEELQKNSVLIHCEMGMQRSAAIVAAYIMRYYKLTADKAIEYVKSKRTLAFKTRVTFLEALYRLEQIDKNNIVEIETEPGQEDIDINRITNERSRNGGSYSVGELKFIATKLGISNSGTKSELVSKILHKLKYN